MVELPDNSIRKPSKDLSPPTGEGIVIDIGTGDGLFVYQCARRNPKKFYIGVDASTRPLEKVSEKVHRKPAKGGLPNILFLQAAVEDLPPELDGLADEVHIHFPWGSLLRAVAVGDKEVLQNLRRVCSSEALLEVVIGLDPERDRSEIERLGLRPLSIDHIDSLLVPTYRDAGFEICERGTLLPAEWSEIQTSWAKRLKGNASRSLLYIIARAVEVDCSGV
ncbi:MAG TPA: methyltransferase domain-containing protein [Pyrinomonadaceae bacterium]|nr:methyltransferase domain-containing protein [Pyrinomonadaceae bacterium]